jgi:hypothetical protein
MRTARVPQLRSGAVMAGAVGDAVSAGISLFGAGLVFVRAL